MTDQPTPETYTELREALAEVLRPGSSEGLSYESLHQRDRETMMLAASAAPALLADRDRLAVQIKAVRALTYASNDGTEYEHNGHTENEGEPECPACWVNSIRRALEE